MASLYVRQQIKAWAEQAAQAVGLPFYDTVNREQDPGDAKWSTVEFLNATSARSTYCKDEETGTFDLLFLERGGGGDEGLLADAEAAMAAFMASIDPTGKLQLVHADPPEDFPAGGGVPWFVVLFPVDYLYQPLKGA